MECLSTVHTACSFDTVYCYLMVLRLTRNVEDRLRAVEVRMTSMESLLQGADSLMTGAKQCKVLSARELDTEVSMNPPDSARTRSSGGESADQATVRGLDLVGNGIDAMGTIPFVDETQSGFYGMIDSRAQFSSLTMTGPSSNVAFMAHISNAIVATHKPNFSTVQILHDADTTLMKTTRSFPLLPNRTLNNLTPPPGLIDKYALPKASEIEGLLQQFFANTGMLFPYVSAVDFYRLYAEAKGNGFKKVRISWLALLNMILAAATCATANDELDAKRRAAASDIFYQRAKALYEMQDSQSINIEVGMFGPRGLTLMPAKFFSSASSPHGPISSRDTEVGADVDNSWPGSQGGPSNWSTIK